MYIGPTGCSSNKMVAQMSDGTSNKIGQFNGPAAKVKSKSLHVIKI